MRDGRSMRQPLSAADGAWWRMERPANPMTITAVFTFADPLAYDALAALVTRELLTHDRFRQRVVDGGAGQVYWEDVPDLDVANHVVRVALPADAGREALEALVSRLMSEQLPRDRPHWQFHLVERYQGGSALVARVHHCIGDGISLVQLLLAMAEPVDAPAGPPVPAAVERRRTPRRAGAPAYHEPDGTLPPPRTAADRDAARVRAADDDGVRAVLSPGRLVAAAKLGGGIAAVLARLLDLRADPRTHLRGPLGHTKRVAWSEPIPLDRVRAVGRATGGTINDVLLSAVAGALRGYLTAAATASTGASCAPWSRSTSAAPTTPRPWATSSASSSCRSRWASPTRWAASPRPSGTWTPSSAAPRPWWCSGCCARSVRPRPRSSSPRSSSSPAGRAR
jgi:WS/DGAT/MGAT family acyltransferase